MIVGVVYTVQQIQIAVNNTKESLQKKGLHITQSGVSVKTDRRFDREDYVDATQRGIIRAMGAASFRKVDEHGNHINGPTPPPSMSRQSSSSKLSGTHAPDEKKHLFGIRRGNSAAR